MGAVGAVGKGRERGATTYLPAHSEESRASHTTCSGMAHDLPKRLPLLAKRHVRVESQRSHKSDCILFSFFTSMCSSPTPRVHKIGPMLLVLCLAYPELMKGAQAGQDATSQPGRKAAFDDVAGRVNFDLLPGKLETQLVAQPVIEARDGRRAAHTHDILKQRGARVNVGCLDGRRDEILERPVKVCRGSGGQNTFAVGKKLGCKEDLGCSESLEPKRVVVAVRKLKRSEWSSGRLTEQCERGRGTGVQLKLQACDGAVRPLTLRSRAPRAPVRDSPLPRAAPYFVGTLGKTVSLNPPRAPRAAWQRVCHQGR